MDNIGKRLKTPKSKRHVPVHRELIDAGFLDFVAEAHGGRERLFDTLTIPPRGPRTKNFGKWFGRLLREKAMITDRRVVFHSFRHTFTDACRAAGIAPEIREQILGHANLQGYHYGEGYRLEALQAAIDTVMYENFRLADFRKP